MAHVQDPKKREQAAGAAKGPAKRLRTGGNVTAVVEGSTRGGLEEFQPPTEQQGVTEQQGATAADPRAAAVAPTEQPAAANPLAASLRVQCCALPPIQ
eukprot:COSAG01_NODE_52467_length_346_cov_1.230769_1_plen_98_part_10